MSLVHSNRIQNSTWLPTDLLYWEPPVITELPWSFFNVCSNSSTFFLQNHSWQVDTQQVFHYLLAFLNPHLFFPGSISQLFYFKASFLWLIKKSWEESLDVVRISFPVLMVLAFDSCLVKTQTGQNEVEASPGQVRHQA